MRNHCYSRDRFQVAFSKSVSPYRKSNINQRPSSWRFNLFVAIESRRKTAESNVPYGKKENGSFVPFCPSTRSNDSSLPFSPRLFRICTTHETDTMALPNIYFFERTVSLNADDNLVNRHNTIRTAVDHKDFDSVEKKLRGCSFAEDRGFPNRMGYEDFRVFFENLSGRWFDSWCFSGIQIRGSLCQSDFINCHF